ncbi:MAG: molecular chaperone HtpG [Myxococcota bacterium]|nr:molecular chaperone HtpG [Myxococcota bacterium]
MTEATEATETFKFETEAKQILELMTHSVYSNREIFLRELISNASDALDKLRFEAIENKDWLPEGQELGIHLTVDPDKRTLTVKDNGLGMSRAEVVENIGTIARSGSKEFIRAIEAQKNSLQSPELIGQFGVGFYSVFMIADRVELVTRRAGEEGATRWISSGDGAYSLEHTEREGFGTTITLHLKETDAEDGQDDFTAEWVLRGIIKKYSDFVSYPVQMMIEREEPELDDEGEAIEGKTKKVSKLETLNSMKALWTRSRGEVEDAEYNEFYKQTSHDWTDPLSIITLKAEGTYQYQALLFIPSKAPMNLFHQDYKSGVKLYVRRVFIMDECKEILPEYLRFVRGVVDAEDLSLNISREILQQDRQLKMIQKRLVKKVLDTLKDMKNNNFDEYLKFWGEFGAVLKEGLYTDMDNRDAILSLILAKSTQVEGKYVSLHQYVDRKKEGQKEIYFLTGNSYPAIENSPHLETFKAKEYEVLLFADPVDEVWLQREPEFEEHKFISASRGSLELGSEDEQKEAKEELKEKEASCQALLTKIQSELDEKIKEVRLSNRMTTSAACLVVDNQDMSPQMAQLMAAMGQDMPASKRILELNPDHPIVEKLSQKLDAGELNGDLSVYAKLLHGQALLAEGGQLQDPSDFSKLVTDLMVKAI